MVTMQLQYCGVHSYFMNDKHHASEFLPQEMLKIENVKHCIRYQIFEFSKEKSRRISHLHEKITNVE